jgi:CRISPR-associated protein Cas1
MEESPVQLVINTFGSSLRKQGERFVVQAGERHLEVSAHKVRSILITTAAHLSTDAIELAIANNVDLIFLDKHGSPYGRVWQGRMGSTATIRRRQIEAADGPEGLTCVRGWVSAKLRHQQEFLGELAQRRPTEEALFRTTNETIEACLARVQESSGQLDDQRGTLMGLEGGAGRAYFQCLGRLMPEAYRFEGRSRQPAVDAFNAMLNYAYGVLYSLVERACIFAGLDPFVGFLHTDNYNKKSLVFDLIEPFRVLADRVVVLIFTGRRAQVGFFETIPGGVALSKEGRAFLLTRFNEKLDRAVRTPVQGRRGKYRNIRQRDLIQQEAHALANTLLGRTDLPRVVDLRRLWEKEDVPAVPDEDESSPSGDQVADEVTPAPGPEGEECSPG